MHMGAVNLKEGSLCFVAQGMHKIPHFLHAYFQWNRQN